MYVSFVYVYSFFLSCLKDKFETERLLLCQAHRLKDGKGRKKRLHVISFAMYDVLSDVVADSYKIPITVRSVVCL